MPLASFAYLLAFLPVVAIGAHILRDRSSARVAQGWILAASLIFYSRSSARYIPLLLASIAFNWTVGHLLASPSHGPRARRWLLWLGLGLNILVLCAFKYADALAPITGLPSLGFPLGISFFTLAQVMYLVDRYESLIPANSFIDHATFVSFFPNVTAGPIERTKHFVGQLAEVASPTNRDERIARSIALISMGLFKKVVLADSFARVANAGYASAGMLSTAGAWITSLSFTFQLYFDFSGYSDMARGSAQLLGLSLVENFNVPYRARSVSEFWQRWHISLSNFITTYLYTPIIRSMGRVTIHKAAAASLSAMAIAGVWHGPAWTFVLFGTLHGVGLATNQYWKRAKRPLPKPVAAVATFVFVNLTLIVFRSPSVPAAIGIAKRLVPGAHTFGITEVTSGIPSAVMPLIALPLLFGTLAAFVGPTSHQIAATFRPSRWAALAISAILAVALVFMMAGTGSDFVYRAF